jgi:hypothetical protein
MRDLGVDMKLYPPVLVGYVPKLNYLLKAKLESYSKMPRLALSVVAVDLVKQYMPIFDKTKKVGVLSDFEAVNGVVGEPHINSVDMSKGSGYPYRTTKKRLSCYDPWLEGYVWDEPVQAHIDAAEATLATGKRIGSVFNAFFKDEPVSENKFLTKNTRIICGCPIALQHLMRKYFLTMIAAFHSSYTYEGTVGINPFSVQWRHLYEQVTVHGKDRILAGDFSGFDWSCINSATMRAVFAVLLGLASELGWYDERELTIMRGLATEVCYSYLDYFGELLGLTANPSGQPLTTDTNCLVVSILFRLAWLAHANDVKIEELDAENIQPLIRSQLATFRKQVALKNYGDDNLSGVADSTFTFDKVKHIFAEAGIGYTSTDKDERSFDFQTIDEVSFLKRKFREGPDAFGRIQMFAPLELASIYKPLLYWSDSSLTDLDHAIAVIRQTPLELSMYPRDEYEAGVAKLDYIVEQLDLQDYIGLPTRLGTTFTSYFPDISYYHAQFYGPPPMEDDGTVHPAP